MKARIAINQTTNRSLLVGSILFIALLSSLPLWAQTTNFTELTSDASGASALISTTNWGIVSPANATFIAPTNVAAVNCGYLVAHNLRTPPGAGNYTALAYSLIITNGGTLTLKGNGTNTVNNLILNGGNFSQGETGANPDTATLAGNINLKASTTVSSGASTSGSDFLTLVIESVITNASGSNATLTLNDIAGTINGLTVVMAGQNTFGGGITVTGVPGDTLKLGINNALPATTLLTLQGTTGSTGTTNPVFDLAGYSTAISNLAFATSSNSGYVTNSSTVPSTLTISNNAADLVQYGTIVDNGANGGTVSLSKTGSGTLVLGTPNTYEGSTLLNAGILKLTNSGSINNSTNLSIAAGATFDVSALASPYTLSSSTALNASGSASPASINGASGGTVNLGSQPIVLNYSGSNPALTLSNGALVLNNNTLTVNGSVLGAGAYPLISVNSGIITTNNPALSVTGTVIGSGVTDWLSVSGGNVILNIQTNTTTTCAVIGDNPTCTESLLVLTATVSGDSPTGYVAFMDGATPLATNALSGGSASYTNTLPAGTNSIVAYYLGDTLNNPSNSTNSPVTVIVNTPVTIITQPVSQTNCAGNDVTFTVAATGTAPLTYQWFFNGNSLAGQTNATLTLANVQFSNAGSYSVVVSNACGAVSSVNATLTVDTAPSITTQPVNQTNGIGDNVSFTVAATGTAPLTCQWSFNSSPLAGQTNATLTLANVQFSNAGSYSVVVSNACGTATSSAATLQVNQVENLAASDASGTSSITGTNNWNPATTVAPTNSFASTNDYIAAFNLRTPAGAGNYTALAYSLTINNGGTLTLKGNGTNTINNLIFNGGNLSQGETGANPDTATLAGNINFKTSTTISSAGTSSQGYPLSLVIQAVMTNDTGNYPTLTLNDATTTTNGLTVVLAAQSVFNGNILVSGTAGYWGDTLKLGTNNALSSATTVTLNGMSSATNTTVFDLAGCSTTVSNLVISSATIPGYVTNSSTSASTLTISNNNNYALQYGIIADNGANGGTVSLTKTGSGTLTLVSTNVYQGNTTINAGSLALASTGFINDSPFINIAAGATFDVSAISSFTLSSNSFLNASGAASAATLKGASSGTVNLGSQPIILNYNGSNPALTISNGALVLNNNAIIVNGPALAAGTYAIISVSSGNITTNNPALSASGTAIGPGTGESISISGGNVVLTIFPEVVFAYPQPSIYSNSTNYILTVNGTNVPVENYTAQYDYAEFSLYGTNANIQVTATTQTSITSYHISPEKLGLSGSTSGNTLTFSMNGSQYLIISINGLKPFVLGADPAETSIPTPRGPGIFNVVTMYGANNNNASVIPTTTAIQEAINDASIYGGTYGQGIVYVPAGVYACSNLWLQSNMALYLQGGAVIRCTGNPNDYNSDKYYGSLNATTITGTVFLIASNEINTKIYGRGTVDGNGFYMGMTNDFGDNLLAVIGTTNFIADGITFRDAGGWGLVPDDSTNLLFSNLKIFDNATVRQDDGIDVEDSQNVVVSNAVAVSGDDTFSTKSVDSPINNVLFENSLVWTATMGCKIGWAVATPQNGITFSNIVIYDCTSGLGIAEEAGSGSKGGSTLGNVTWNTIDVESNNYYNEDEGQCWAVFTITITNGMATNVLVANVTVRDTGVEGSIGGIYTNTIINGITFSNITMPGLSGYAGNLFQMDIFEQKNYTNLTIWPVQTALSDVYLMANDPAGTNSFSAPGNWSDGQAPFGTTNYVDVGFTLRTPTNSTVPFAGGSLALYDGATLSIKNDNNTTTIGTNAASGLFIDNSLIDNVDAANDTLAGYVTVLPGGVMINMPAGLTNTFNISAAIGGAGSFQAGVGNDTGTIKLSGPNTYTGGTLFGAAFKNYVTLQLFGSGTLGSTNSPIAFNSTNDILDLDGTSQGIGDLSGTAGAIANSSATTSTLTVGSGDNGGGMFAGAIVGGNGAIVLNKVGLGTITLGGSNTYSGATIINSGTLALAGFGSINNSSNIIIVPGATLDVSAINNFTMNNNVPLSANGTGTAIGTSAVTINGAAGGIVGLGSAPVILTFDGSDPALYISQGTLSLSNNTFTVNTTNGSALAMGSYTIMQQASGNVSSSGTYPVSGSAIGTGTRGTILTSGKNVDLVIGPTNRANPSFTGLTSSSTAVFGTTNLILSGRISASGPIYPAQGETVTVTSGSNQQSTTIYDSTGDFSINYNLFNIPVSGTPYPISYIYGGDYSLNGVTNTTTTLTVNIAASAMTVSSSSNPSFYGNDVTFTAALTDISSGSAGTPTGTVQFLTNGVSFGSPVTLTSGSATFQALPADMALGTYTVTADYGGDGNFTGSTNSMTQVVTNSIEMMLTNDATHTSSLTGTTNWTPTTTLAPTNIYATANIFIVNHSLRTPTNNLSYTNYSAATIVTNGGTFSMKGYGNCVITVSNLVLAGGQISQGENGIAPETQILAGSINLTTNTTITAGATGTEPDNALTLVIESVITNASGSNATLTLNDIAGTINGLTVVMAGQNTFGGGITVTGVPGDTLKLGINNALPATTLLTLQGTTGSTGTTNPVFDLAGYSTAISNLAFATSSNSGYVTNSSTVPSTLTISNNAADLVQYGTIVDNGANGGTVSLSKTGSGTLVLGTPNTYEGSTLLNAGILKLTNSGSINNSTNLSIAAGATFDVSALASPYTLSSSTALNASGSASPASINGASGGTVNLGSQPIVLNYSGSNPALTLSNGALVLNNNTLTVNGSVLGAGAYPLISVNSGIITTNNPALSVTGTVIGSGVTDWLSVSGGNVILNIQTNTTTTCAVIGDNPTCTESLLVLTATVSGDSPTGYVAFMDGATPLATNALSGGSASYTNTLPAGTNSIVAYYLGDTLNNPSNSTNSPVTVIVNTPVTIITQPVSQTNCAGNDVTFTVAATGTAPLTYQWFFNGNSLAGQTNATLTLANVQFSNAGSYSVVVSNACGAVSSVNATLTVDTAPSITTQPVNQTNGIGDNVSFTVAATGTAPLTCQWSFNSSPLAGQTNATLTLANVQFSNAGSYSVVVSNACGTATSSAATLQVNQVENLAASDASGTSSITGTNNWNPATTVAPTNSFASTNDYIAAFNLRTPAGAGNYTALAYSLTINNGGTLTLKGNGTNTINNLIFNGGNLSQGETGANPDTATLAGNINLATNATVSSGASGSGGYPLTLVIQAPITNSPGGNATLTLSDNAGAAGGLTVVLAGQNAFNGGITVAGSPGDTLKLGTNNALSPATTVTLSGMSSATNTTALDLGGYSTAIGSLIFSNATYSGYVTNSATNAAILTISNNVADTLQYGTIADNGVNGGTLSLVQAGTNTLTLTAKNNYIGSTTVKAGKLVLGSSGRSSLLLVTNGAICLISTTNMVMTNTGTVAIGAGSQLYLTNGVNQTVKYLSLNGTWQAAGTWGSTGSPASNTNNTYFSGAGMLIVSGGGMPELVIGHVISPGAPSLSVLFQQPNLTLSWPFNYTGWKLQSLTNDLMSSNWLEVSGTTITNQITIPIMSGSGAVFFRLAAP